MVEISERNYQSFLEAASKDYDSIAHAIQSADLGQGDGLARDLFKGYLARNPHICNARDVYGFLHRKGLVSEDMKKHAEEYALLALSKQTDRPPKIDEYVKAWRRFKFDEKNLRKTFIELVENTRAKLDRPEFCKKAKISPDELSPAGKKRLIKYARDKFSEPELHPSHYLINAENLLAFLGVDKNRIGNQYLKAGNEYLKMGAYRHAKNAYLAAEVMGVGLPSLVKKITKAKTSWGKRKLARLLDIGFGRKWYDDLDNPF